MNNDPTYVLLHGINNSPSSWGSLRAAFPQDSHILTPALPALDDVDSIAATLLADLPPRFILVGHSFGGYVALSMLERYPDRIRALVLVNSLDNADTDVAAAGRRVKAQQAAQGAYGDIARASTAKTYHPDNAHRDDLMAQREAALAEYGAERFSAHQEASARRPDRRDMLLRSRVPLCVVAAKDDAVIAAEKQRLMAESVDAQFHALSGAGHMLPSEQPEALARVILGWVAEIDDCN
ncbi:alpha/beta fold hydrolase [Paeniglutamicibacter sp. MACA_103]|uniref:alpha/beta fold hydrolase n=1 Tax=Paeniglutamicibacter sp. MACA_103 TaxID=3377337 RepID=UPI003893CC14